MEIKKKEILNNLLVIYYELENIYNSISLSCDDFYKEMILEREAVTIYLGRYFLIRYSAFYDELNRQFVKNYPDQTSELKESIKEFNFAVENHYQIKELRDTIWAHNNRIKDKGKYSIITKGELSKFRSPVRLSEFDSLLKLANKIVGQLPAY